MSELSSIEIIKKYSKSRSYPIQNQEDFTKHVGVSAFVDQKVMIMNLQSIDKDLYFIFYDSYGTKPGFNITYCGLFKKVKLDAKSDVIINKRDSLDFLSFKKRYKTNSSYIDKALCIYTNNGTAVKKIVNRSFVQGFHDLNKKMGYIFNSYSIIDISHFLLN